MVAIDCGVPSPLLGANVAMRHPGRVRRLVTIGAGGPSLLGQSPSEGSRLLREFADAPSREKLERWLRCMVFDPDVITTELVDARWDSARDADSQGTLAAMYGSEAGEAQSTSAADSDRPPYWAMLHKIQCPTLLTWGLDDRQCPPDMSLLPLRTIPHAELHVFPNCGHRVMVEAKESFERVALEFLLR